MTAPAHKRPSRLAALWARLSGRPGGEFAAFRRHAFEESMMTDSLMWSLEWRVLQLEEVAAARWPRRILLRWRLGRVIRASIAQVPGESFAERRTTAVSVDWYQGGEGR